MLHLVPPFKCMLGLASASGDPLKAIKKRKANECAVCLNKGQSVILIEHLRPAQYHLTMWLFKKIWVAITARKQPFFFLHKKVIRAHQKIHYFLGDLYWTLTVYKDFTVCLNLPLLLFSPVLWNLPSLKDALAREHTACVHWDGRPFTKWPPVDAGAALPLALLPDWLRHADAWSHSRRQTQVGLEAVHDVPRRRLRRHKVQLAVQTVKRRSNEPLYFHENRGGWGAGAGLPGPGAGPVPVPSPGHRRSQETVRSTTRVCQALQLGGHGSHSQGPPWAGTSTYFVAKPYVK